MMDGIEMDTSYSIPGDLKCDFCGEPLDNGLEFSWKVERGLVPDFYHFVCRESFEVAMGMYLKHRFMCHKDGCELTPEPVRWVDSIGGYQP